MLGARTPITSDAKVTAARAPLPRLTCSKVRVYKAFNLFTKFIFWVTMKFISFGTMREI